MAGEKAAKPNWYERNGRQEWWDGTKWSGKTRPIGMSPAEVLGFGLVLSAVAAGLLWWGLATDASDVQLIVLVIAAVVGFASQAMFWVGVVALGVQIGRRHSS